MNSKLTGDGVVENDEVPKNHWHFHIETVTFEYRHENKSYSACPKDQFSSFASLQVLQVCKIASFASL